MEIEELEATMTPPLPQVEQPPNQLGQLLLSPYAEIESYISSLPKKEQLSMALSLTRQFTVQRDTMFRQTFDHVSQLDHLNAQLMTFQLEHQHLQLQHDSLQSQLEKVTQGTTFLTSYTSDPLAATGPTGLNELNSFLASESNSLLYNKGTAVVIPKQLKGNEITELTDKAIHQIRTKVTDFHTLRQFQREASNFFATAGYHAISQLLTTEGDLTQLTAKYHSFYQPLRNDSVSATDFDKALIQDNDILLQFISKSFHWNSTIRSKIRDIRSAVPPAPKDTLGIAALRACRQEFTDINLEHIISHTFKIMAYFTKADQFPTFDAWLLSYRHQLQEYLAIYGSPTQSVIQLANTFLALQIIGKRHSDLDSVLRFLRLQWNVSTMADILQRADEIHRDLITTAHRWTLQLSATKSFHRPKATEKKEAYHVLLNILGIAGQSQSQSPSPHRLTMTTTPVHKPDTTNPKCPYCDLQHNLLSCDHRKKDKAVKEQLGPLIVVVSQVQELLNKILPQLGQGNLRSQDVTSLKNLLNSIWDKPTAPIYLAGKRLQDWTKHKDIRGRQSTNSTTSRSSTPARPAARRTSPPAQRNSARSSNTGRSQSQDRRGPQTNHSRPSSSTPARRGGRQQRTQVQFSSNFLTARPSSQYAAPTTFFCKQLLTLTSETATSTQGEHLTDLQHVTSTSTQHDLDQTDTVATLRMQEAMVPTSPTITHLSHQLSPKEIQIQLSGNISITPMIFHLSYSDDDLFFVTNDQSSLGTFLYWNTITRPDLLNPLITYLLAQSRQATTSNTIFVFNHSQTQEETPNIAASPYISQQDYALGLIAKYRLQTDDNHAINY